MPTVKASDWIKPLFATLAPTFREVAVMSLFVNGLALAVPVFVLQVYDRVVFHAGLNTLYGLLVGMAFVLVFDFVLRQARARILQTVAARVDVQVSRSLFDKTASLPLPALESQPAAYWHALFRDVETVRNTVSGASAVLIVDLPFALLFLGLVFVIAAPIAWILLAVLPVFLLVAWRSGRVMASATGDERDRGLARDRLVAEMIAARTTVKALALNDTLRPLWEEKQADAIESSVVRGAAADSYVTLGHSLTLFTTVAVTGAGAIAILEQQLTIGALIATNLLSGRLLGPLTQLVGSWRTYVGFGAAVSRLGRIFSMPSERGSSEVTLPRPRGDLTFEDVSFAFRPDGRPTIDRLRFTVRGPGVIAVVGRNGSGKTTLLKLIQGLYAPTDGRVLLDGADIAQFTRAQLARWIGYVPQECVLFAGSVRRNIAMRCPDASDDDIVAAARAAGAHGFVVDHPDGYAAEAGEAGMRLSAGQRQRLAIARALVGDPPILLLDEPSSNLDREAEHELHRALKELGQQRTVVIVTHSPILLSACNTIVALENGRVALAGPAGEILPRLLGRSKTAQEPPAETAALRPQAPAQRRTEAPLDRAAGAGGR